MADRFVLIVCIAAAAAAAAVAAAERSNRGTETRGVNIPPNSNLRRGVAGNDWWVDIDMALSVGDVRRMCRGVNEVNEGAPAAPATGIELNMDLNECRSTTDCCDLADRGVFCTELDIAILSGWLATTAAS